MGTNSGTRVGFSEANMCAKFHYLSSFPGHGKSKKAQVNRVKEKEMKTFFPAAV